MLNRRSGDGARQNCMTQDGLLPSLTTTVEGMRTYRGYMLVQVARTSAGVYVSSRLSEDGARQDGRTHDVALPSLTTTAEGMRSYKAYMLMQVARTSLGVYVSSRLSGDGGREDEQDAEEGDTSLEVSPTSQGSGRKTKHDNPFGTTR